MHNYNKLEVNVITAGPPFVMSSPMQTVFTIFTLENNVQQLQQMANMLMKFSALFHAGLLNKTQPNTDEGHGG